MRTMISFQCETHEEAQAVLAAVAAIGKEPHACSKQYIAPEEIRATAKPFESDSERANTNPGLSSITKIGSNTLEQVLGMLKDGHQPPDKYSEHLKLLWSRGKVKYDGELYYL